VPRELQQFGVRHVGDLAVQQRKPDASPAADVLHERVGCGAVVGLDDDAGRSARKLRAVAQHTIEFPVVVAR
jgi:hypothetical protein